MDKWKEKKKHFVSRLKKIKKFLDFNYVLECNTCFSCTFATSASKRAPKSFICRKENARQLSFHGLKQKTLQPPRGKNTRSVPPDRIETSHRFTRTWIQLVLDQFSVLSQTLE